MPLIIKNGTLVTENGIFKADLKIDGEKISSIEPRIPHGPGDTVIDAGGKTVMPGVIDAHVHYYMETASGRTADSFETGSMSAAFGGVTSFVDFARPVEGRTMLEALELREREARGHSYLDYNFHMEVTGEFEQDLSQLGALREYGVNSVKIYTTYGAMRFPEEKIPQLLKETAGLGMITMVHAEDNDTVMRFKNAFIAEGKTAPAYHGESRPREAEVLAVRRIIDMAAETDAPVYIAHVSTAEGAELIHEAQMKGRRLYGETCPHYLLLDEERYKGPEPQKYIMTPPLRKKSDGEKLWENIRQNLLQCVVTDHCTFSIRDKLAGKSCFDVRPGIGGSETLLPLLYSEGVGKGRLSLERLAALLSENPAKIFGLYPQKGTISPGSDADIVILDPHREVTLRGNELHSAAGYTVFEGFSLRGYPVTTISRGQIICDHGRLVAKAPGGRFIKAQPYSEST